MKRAWGVAALVSALGGAMAGLYVLVASGAAALDLGWGRRYRALGPQAVCIEAPRELVFGVIAAPYLGRTPRAMEGKLRVIERGEDMVLAAHYTPVRGFTATTVETVRFTRPERVDFRLVRGPVPHVTEVFLLEERDGATILEYRGELGTDFWAAGEAWGRIVATRWESAVRASLASIQTEAERRAGLAAGGDEM